MAQQPLIMQQPPPTPVTPAPPPPMDEQDDHTWLRRRPTSPSGPEEADLALTHSQTMGKHKTMNSSTSSDDSRTNNNNSGKLGDRNAAVVILKQYPTAPTPKRSESSSTSTEFELMPGEKRVLAGLFFYFKI